MNITVTGHQLDLTDALRAYVKEKAGKIVRHFDNVTKVHVVLQTQKHRNIAEATVQIAGRNKDIFTGATHDDMYAAIDNMAQKLERRVRKYKERVTNHNKREKEQILKHAKKEQPTQAASQDA